MAATLQVEYEIERLRSEVATLQQLLAVHEKTALIQSRRLEDIVSSISDGFFVLDSEWRVTYLNPIASSVLAKLGAKDDDLLGRDLRSRVPALAQGDFREHCERAIEQRSHVAFEIYFEPLQTHLEFHAYPWENGISMLFQDIGVRKEQERRREEMQTDLERRVSMRTAELQAMVGELEAFSYSVSHDLRAPLRSLDGFSQALLEDYRDKLDEDGQLYLERIRANAQKMAQLIDALLQLSRVTRAALDPKIVDLSAMAAEIAAELRGDDPDRPGEFVIEPGISAEADPKLMEVALQNLLGNAWKFTSQRQFARIEFRIQIVDGVETCCLTDNGAGFENKYRDKLFTAFQRLHDARQFDGSGIGLATVSRIIRRHGGRIWAEGEPDRGARFYFTLNGLRKNSQEVPA